VKTKEQLANSKWQSAESSRKPKRGYPLPGSTGSTDETKGLAAIQPTVNRRDAEDDRKMGRNGAMTLLKALARFGFMTKSWGELG
jgi:hypothetical protein